MYRNSPKTFGLTRPLIIASSGFGQDQTVMQKTCHKTSNFTHAAAVFLSRKGGSSAIAVSSLRA
jgi:hypothetical protein